MAYSLTCSCPGRFIMWSKGTPSCSVCGSSPIKTLPASRHRQIEYDYECPVTGIPIRSKAAHEENLKRHGCHVLEPGELAHADKVRAQNQVAADAHLDASVDATVDSLVQSMPSGAIEQLATELSTSCPGEPNV